MPEANLRAVPRTVPDEHAVFTEPIAAACEILDQVRIPKGAPVAVLGDGKLGLLVAQVLACHGAEVHLFGRHAEKLRIAAAAGCQTHRSGAAATGAIRLHGGGDGLGRRPGGGGGADAAARDGGDEIDGPRHGGAGQPRRWW